MSSANEPTREWSSTQVSILGLSESQYKVRSVLKTLSFGYLYLTYINILKIQKLGETLLLMKQKCFQTRCLYTKLPVVTYHFFSIANVLISHPPDSKTFAAS